MNSHIVRGIVCDVRKSVKGFCLCECFGQRCSRIFPLILTAILIPSVFTLQLSGLLIDQWVSDDRYDVDYDNSTNLNCDATEYKSGCDHYINRLCTLEIVCIAITCLPLLIWLLVGCKSWCQSIDNDICIVCCVCILPTMNIVSGIFSLCCCIIAMQFTQDFQDRQLFYGFSFFAYAFSGILSLVVSLVSMCGYVCRKRDDYYIQAGSDDADAEAERLINT